MDRLVQALGELAATTLVEAIRQGQSRRDAIDAAAAAIKRSDVVSDELWLELGAYIESTRDFEENGAG